MSLINKKSSQFKQTMTSLAKVSAKPATKPPFESPKGEEVVTETFVPSSPAKKPEVRREDTSSPPVKAKRLAEPRPGSDMATMLEDIESVKLAGGDLMSSTSGTLFVTDEGLVSMGLPNLARREGEEKPQMLEQVLAGMNAALTDKQAGNDHGHGPKKAEEIAMGGHLGTEIVEKVGHNAHHAAGHGASTVKAHVAADAATQAKGHGAHHLADAVAQAKGHGTHQVMEAVAETKGHGGHHLAEVVGDTAQVSQSGHHALTETHEVVAETSKHGAEAAHHLSTGLTTALTASAVASGGIGGYMLYAGGKELVHGVKEKDGEKIAEGVGGLAVGARSVAASTVMASMVSTSGVLADVAAVASRTLTPLGIVHGAIDVGLGVKDLLEGDKLDGLLKMGFGTTVIAGALVGGIPLTVAALGMLGIKVGRGIYKGRKAKRASGQQAEVVHPTGQQSVISPDSQKAHKDVKT